ncbi:MAG TPA: hypothetical protein VNK23_04520 [Candidatus Dormibacteraeota bacterium]|nr:hypothetical protein [Candidatus Dormibacteraeota bacterium]
MTPKILFAAIQFNHFWAMVLFAALASVALASLGRRTMGARVRYALWTLALFLIVGIGVAWLMYPFSK